MLTEYQKKHKSYRDFSTNNAYNLLPYSYDIINILAVLYYTEKLLYYPITYIRYLLLISGFTLNLLTNRLFKVNDTTVKPHLESNVLIKSGPFRLVGTYSSYRWRYSLFPWRNPSLQGCLGKIT
jgi:hypothetical protein